MKKIAMILAMAYCLAGVASAALMETFDNPLTLSNTQAAGTWYTDRYNPAGFQATGGVLQIDIAASDLQASAFYNTQGRKYDVDPANCFGGSLFVDGDWGQLNNGMRAGIWGTGVDGSNAVNNYPIIEYTSGQGFDGFRVWRSATGTWTNLSDFSVTADAWYDLGVKLVESGWEYYINNLLVFTDTASVGSVNVINLILNTKNEGENYSVLWDNVYADVCEEPVVPEPATLAMVGLGLAGVAVARRRRTMRK